MGNLLLRYQLRACTKENTPPYGFEGQTMLGKIVSVYDGDTCHAAVRINGQLQVIHVRCYGYDSAELKPSKSMVNRDVEIAKAKEAKQVLEELVLNKIVKLSIKGNDKYGRFLAILFLRGWCQDIDINKEMIARQQGVEYYGGTKTRV